MRPIQVIALALLLAAPAQQTGAARGIDETLEAGGALLLLDWRGEFNDAQKTTVRNWLTAAMETVSLLNGTPPRPEIRFALEPYSSAAAVPFAVVLRNQPEGVLFYINPDRPLDEFISDWTAYHELSHLFIPFPGRDDIWFSEGLASYYQNILQYRGKLLTQQEAWNKLQAGFERGSNDTNDSDLNLAELSGAMRERRAFMRVYWSGALYFLEADIRLHELGTAGTPTPSLDAVLREFGNCCLAAQRDWSGAEIAAEFDRIAETDLFLPLYHAYGKTTAMPDYKAVMTGTEMDTIMDPDFR